MAAPHKDGRAAANAKPETFADNPQEDDPGDCYLTRLPPPVGLPAGVVAILPGINTTFAGKTGKGKGLPTDTPHRAAARPHPAANRK
jgi:hypothetical protein